MTSEKATRKIGKVKKDYINPGREKTTVIHTCVMISGERYFTLFTGFASHESSFLETWLRHFEACNIKTHVKMKRGRKYHYLSVKDHEKAMKRRPY